MTISNTGGLGAVTVTSAAPVAMLSVDTADHTTAAGVSVANAYSWTVNLTTNHDVAVKVYATAGANCGLVEVTGWAATATSSAPYSLSVQSQPYQRIYVTAQASSTTATVNCDLLVQSSAVN